MSEELDTKLSSFPGVNACPGVLFISVLNPFPEILVPKEVKSVPNAPLISFILPVTDPTDVEILFNFAAEEFADFVKELIDATELFALVTLFVIFEKLNAIS
jgi:hypothetical protein